VTGMAVGSFSEVSGLEVNTEFEEIKEGGVNHFVHKLPKISKYANLVLKRGITNSDLLFKWHQNVIMGIIDRKSLTVILVDTQKRELKKWMYQNAFPVKWTGPDLKADSNTVAIESVEMVHQGLLRL
jgi:phage tail-like protein